MIQDRIELGQLEANLVQMMSFLREIRSVFRTRTPIYGGFASSRNLFLSKSTPLFDIGINSSQRNRTANRNSLPSRLSHGDPSIEPTTATVTATASLTRWHGSNSRWRGNHQSDDQYKTWNCQFCKETSNW